MRRTSTTVQADKRINSREKQVEHAPRAIISHLRDHVLAEKGDSLTNAFAAKIASTMVDRIARAYRRYLASQLGGCAGKPESKNLAKYVAIICMRIKLVLIIINNK
jgi:hypothetical protein